MIGSSYIQKLFLEKKKGGNVVYNGVEVDAEFFEIYPTLNIILWLMKWMQMIPPSLINLYILCFTLIIMKLKWLVVEKSKDVNFYWPLILKSFKNGLCHLKIEYLPLVMLIKTIYLFLSFNKKSYSLNPLLSHVNHYFYVYIHFF